MEIFWPSINSVIDSLAPVDSLWLKFILIWLALYLLHVFVYLVAGSILTYINSKNPNRKIQSRTTQVSSIVEIKQGLISLLASSFCVVIAVWLEYIDLGIAPLSLELTSFMGISISIALFLLLAILGDLWFYGEHRLAHTRTFIRFHRLHHLSPIPTPWTNDRFAFVEVLMIQSYMIFAVLLLPVPATMILLYRIYDQIKGMIGHCGYEYFAGRMAYKPLPLACVGHHDAHHEQYSVNFGAFLTIWDRIFGTLEKDYDEKVRSSRLKMAGKNRV